MMSWVKSTSCLEPIYTRGFTLAHLVYLSTMMGRWVKPSSAFLKGPRRSRPHTPKGQVMRIV
jgi:hypothetical protein